MRVLLLNQPFHPDVVATAQIAKDLADELVRRGHEVTAIASRSIYGRTGKILPERETVDGIQILRVGTPRSANGSTAARIANFASYYLRGFLRSLTLERFDVAVCLTTPPFIATAGLGLRALRGTRVVYWLMDLYPDVMVAQGMIRKERAAHRVLRRLHHGLLRRVDATVVLGRCTKERLVEQGADPALIHVVPPWPACEHGRGGASMREQNAFRHEWKVQGRMLVMYSGGFGLAHDVATFLGAAERLSTDDRIRFAFVGGGRRKPEVDAFVRDRALDNCITRGYESRERLSELLSSADIHLVTMRPDWWGLVVPSKFYGVASAERPTVFVGPAQSEIAQSIKEWGCGLRITPGDSDGLAAVLSELASHPADRELMGCRARDMAAMRFNKVALCGRVCDVIDGTPASRASQRISKRGEPTMEVHG